MINTELVIDMGYTSTIIAERGKGIILKEPSIIAVEKQKGKLKLLASGNDVRKFARMNKDKSHQNVTYIRPIKEGTIDYSEAAMLMLRDFLNKALPKRSFLTPRPEAIMIISSGSSIVERKGYETILAEAGIKSPILMETPIAISAALPSEKNLIVTFGASVSDVAIVGESGIVTGCSVTMSGNAMDNGICNYLADTYRISIPQASAEELRVKIGSFYDNQNISADVTGRDLIDHSLRHVEVTANEIYPVISGVALDLADVVENVSLMCPEKLIQDVYNAGITLCGGVANSYGIADFLSDRLKMAVNVPKNPEDAAVYGALKYFEDRDKMYKML